MPTVTITPGWAGPLAAVGSAPVVVPVAGVGPAGASGSTANQFTATVGGSTAVTAGTMVRLSSPSGAARPGGNDLGGIAVTGGAVGETITVQTTGVVEVAGWGLTPGTHYYGLSNGSLTATPPAGTADGVYVGYAITATKLALGEVATKAYGGLGWGASGKLVAKGGFYATIPNPTVGQAVDLIGSGALRVYAIVSVNGRTDAGDVTLDVLVDGSAVATGLTFTTTASTTTVTAAVAVGSTLSVSPTAKTGSPTKVHLGFSE